MPSIEELYKSGMTWPRLVIKFGVEALIVYNAFKYNTRYKPEWDCFATEAKQPNDFGVGENVTEEFTSVIWGCFILAIIGLINCVVEMVNKFTKKPQLTVANGVVDSLVGAAAIAWVIWASIARLDRNGKVCSGATMNVTEQARPYAYEQSVFLQVILMLSYTIPPVLLVATNCGCL